MLFCFFSISDSEELLLYIIVKHFVICIFETRRVNTFYLLVCKKPKKKRVDFYFEGQIGSGFSVRQIAAWRSSG